MAEPPTKNSVPFSKEMRKVTRDVHDLSDALVNAKLVLAMSDTNIWVEGLLVFYEIIKFLEASLRDGKSNPLLQEYNIKEMYRTESFEADLEYYLGSDWKLNYKPRASVVNYLNHLEDIKERNDTLLIAYVYHLYLGVLSGGQIIAKKRSLSPFKSAYVDRVLFFGPDVNVASLKRQIKQTLDAQATNMSEETRLALLEESRRVFLLNNSIIKSIDQNRLTWVLLRKMLYVIVITFLLKKLLDFIL